jgi:uncharacterized protein
MEFIGDLSSEALIPRRSLPSFSILAILGIFLGIYLSALVSGSRLDPLFGWSVLMMGLYILFKELSQQITQFRVLLQ